MSSEMPSESLELPFTDSLTLLSQVRQRMTQREIGERLQVAPKTIGRWERRETDCPRYVQAALREMLPTRSRSDATGDFTFIDLFAGIGGMRKGFAEDWYLQLRVIPPTENLGCRRRAGTEYQWDRSFSLCPANSKGGPALSRPYSRTLHGHSFGRRSSAPQFDRPPFSARKKLPAWA